MLESVFMSIGLLKSGADIVDRGVIGCVLYGAFGEAGGGGGRCNAAISGVKRPRIALRSLEGVGGSAGEGVMYICIGLGEDIGGGGVIVEDVEVVEVLFFDWPAGIVFKLRGGVCTVASPLNMALNYILIAAESRSS